jgi:hypothetical protein
MASRGLLQRLSSVNSNLLRSSHLTVHSRGGVLLPKFPLHAAASSTSNKPTDDSESAVTNANEIPDVSSSFLGENPLNGSQAVTDWSKSYHGLSSQAFSKDIADVLLAPIDPMDIEMKPGMEHCRFRHLQLRQG